MVSRSDVTYTGAYPPTPLDLPAFVPYACKELGAPFDVRVELTVQEEYVSYMDTPKKHTAKAAREPSLPQTVQVEGSSSTQTRFNTQKSNEITVKLVYDACGHLVEISFHSEPMVPGLLIQVIGLCLPYQQLFNKLSVRWSSIDGVALHEISKYLSASALTELCLDDSPVPHRNYTALLDRPSNLRHLSLGRCNLVDDDCISICSILVHPFPASKSLQILNLTSNNIHDAGAHAFGDMLRSNRSLQHLNLSGNRITDAGAGSIFNSLGDFTVTELEMQDKRLRIMDYLKQRNEVYQRCLREVIKDAETSRSKAVKKQTLRSSKKIPTETHFSIDGGSVKVDAMVDEILGYFVEPFAQEEVALHGEQVHSIGNRRLCYLNLSYNNLGYDSVVKLLQVMQYQSSGKSSFGAGLMRVLIEGNAMPVSCQKYELINELLEKMYKAKELAVKGERKQSRTERSRSKTTTKH